MIVADASALLEFLLQTALRTALDATVVTCDSPLAMAPGHRARIEVVV